MAGTNPRVLVAGLFREDNQFTRTLKKNYGCDVVWTNLDHPTFPTDAEVVVIVTSHINTAKILKIKEAYKELKTPILVAAQGFSDIKETFENYLFERTKNQKVVEVKKPQVFSRRPFNAALPLEDIKVQLKAAEEKKSPTLDAHTSTGEIPETKRAVHDKETLAKIFKVIEDCQTANMSAKDTIELLEADGLKKASGESYDLQDIYSMRLRIKQMKESQPQKVPAPQPKPAPAPVKPAPPVMAQPTPTPTPATTVPGTGLTVAQKIEPMILIGEVLKSIELPQEEKLRLIGKIQAGEITTFETIVTDVVDNPEHREKELRISKIDIRKSRKNALEVYLNKEHCELVMLNLNAVHEFATKGVL